MQLEVAALQKENDANLKVKERFASELNQASEYILQLESKAHNANLNAVACLR